jgi:tetratricopeptide (TPR) repeat protein
MKMKNIFIGLITACIYCMACNNTDTNSGNAALPEQEKQLRDAIDQRPDSLLLKENLIQYFRENSNYGQAIAETEKAIQQDTSNARMWDIKAPLHFLNKDTANAIQSFEKAIAIDPQPVYQISLGLIYAQTRNEKALTQANALLANPLAKAGKQAEFIKGFYYSYMNNCEKAIPYFDTCLAIDYTYTDAYKEKAICLYHLAQYKEAVQSLEKAVALQSTYDEAYYWLGRCYEKLNQPKEAIMNYQAAIQIDPDYAEAKDALGRLGVK